MITSLFRPVVIKLSGEALGANGDRLDQEVFEATADQIASIHRSGIGLAVVVGGGNLFRGARDAQSWGISQADGDRIGMYATGINGLLLAALCEKRGLSVVEVTRGPCAGFGENDVSASRMKDAVARGTIPIISGGLGQPGISTDAPAVQLGVDIDARAVIMAKYGVDCLYTADPKSVGSNATPIDSIRASQALDHGLAVVDRYALELCRDSQTAIHIVGADKPENLYLASRGDSIGSIILPGSADDDLIAV